ncbi:hypothetical protein [Ureibacillus sinduriensis]|uniref:DUF4064 domain-containing protein n=1 Tax=Ureibacillus sinduriensis BLB-1 = JCM 15800 TaxID=1384057 RepID=A0A0A3HYN4_9BACL|nr:hypothetical protein [Ureibacillus sinduriensis]KGR76350.1 hypothetical protein CD33_07345 [Ureibacillus sinduriensis BLB-1 = JCM 15800]
MELGTIKNTVLHICGWLSVVMGLIFLADINLSLLSGYDGALSNIFSSWIMLSVVLGVISTFNKKSRSLGLWGLGLSIYLGLFMAVIFILGWTIVPFP